MWERFTARARNATLAAQEFASRRGQTRVTPEHLLRGIIDGHTVAARMLSRLGVDINDLNRHLEALSPQADTSSVTTIELASQLSPTSQEVLKHAGDEADKGTNKYIGTEHLLLGILQTETPAADIIRDLGVSAEAIREGLWKLIHYDDDLEPESVRIDTSESR